nr:MAG: VP7 [Eriocheir sinensis reovirus 1]
MLTRVYSKDGPMLDIRLSDFTKLEQRNVLMEYDEVIGKLRYAMNAKILNLLKTVYNEVGTKIAFSRVVGLMHDYCIIPKGLEQLLSFLTHGMQVGKVLMQYDADGDVNPITYKILFGMFKRSEAQLADATHKQCYNYFANEDGLIYTPMYTIMSPDAVDGYQKKKVKLRVEKLGKGNSLAYCYTQDGGYEFYVDDTQYRTNLAAYSLISSEVSYMMKRRVDESKAKLRVHKLCYFMFKERKQVNSAHFLTEVVFEHARLHYKHSDNTSFQVPHLKIADDEKLSHSRMTSLLLKYYISHIYGIGESCNVCGLNTHSPLPKSLNIAAAEFPLTLELRKQACSMRTAQHDEDNDDDDSDSSEEMPALEPPTPEQVAKATTCLAENTRSKYLARAPGGSMIRQSYLPLGVNGQLHAANQSTPKKKETTVENDEHAPSVQDNSNISKPTQKWF